MKGWTKTFLGAETDLQTGLPFKSADFTDSVDDVRLLRGDNIIQGDIRWDDVKRWPKSDLEACKDYLLREGDVMLAMDRPWIEAGLKQAVLHADDVPCLQVQRTARLRGRGRLTTEYLRYIIAGEPFSRYIKLVNTGSSVPHISASQIRAYPITIPEKEEQLRIASVLSALDAKIELNNQINAELEAMAKLLYDYWFVQFDFPMTAAQAASLGRPSLEGKPYKSSGGKMAHNPTLNRQIPEGWTADTLDKLGEVIGGSTPSKENDEFFCPNGIPWITPKDLSNNKGKKFIDRGEIDVTEAGQKGGSLKLMPAGTVLLSSRAPIGYTAIASNPLTTNQGFKSFVPCKGYGSDFIYQTLKHFMKLIEQNASGSTFKEISGGTLKAIKIPMPSPSLAKLYSDKLAAMSAQQQNLEKQNQELTQLRDWLLPMLMNGQVTVGA